MAAAEAVFGADSRAVTTQLAEPLEDLHPQALTATQFLSMAIAFTGSLELGVSWVFRHATVKVPTPLPRSVREQAVLVADPTDDWGGLCAVPGGQAIARAWRSRDLALASYRSLLADADGIDADAVLTSLLHAHHLRAVGLDPNDERCCLQLARAAAQAWTARRVRKRG